VWLRTNRCVINWGQVAGNDPVTPAPLLTVLSVCVDGVGVRLVWLQLISLGLQCLHWQLEISERRARTGICWNAKASDPVSMVMSTLHTLRLLLSEYEDRIEKTGLDAQKSLCGLIVFKSG
jgi:hypothetical protein